MCADCETQMRALLDDPDPNAMDDHFAKISISVYVAGIGSSIIGAFVIDRSASHTEFSRSLAMNLRGLAETLECGQPSVDHVMNSDTGVITGVYTMPTDAQLVAQHEADLLDGESHRD